MEFYNPHTIWSELKKDPEYAGMDKHDALMKCADRQSPTGIALSKMASLETIWRAVERPYYNVYPSILKMMMGVDLSLPVRSLQLPVPMIAIRLPRQDNSETVIQSAMAAVVSPGQMVNAKEVGGYVEVPVDIPEGDMKLFSIFVKSTNGPDHYINSCCFFYAEPDETIEECIKRTSEKGFASLDIDGQRVRSLAGQPLKPAASEDSEKKAVVMGIAEQALVMGIAEQAFRLLCGVAIMSDDPNFVQPIVLNKDLLKYENADEATRAVMENRAARRQGRGFTVGKQLEEDLAAERSVSPHIRRPHMALFWTGKGRETPRYQLRRGAIVNPRSVTDVPTGYLDRETTRR